MTMGAINSAQESIETMNVSSYLNDPSNAVSMSVQFAKSPSRVNHVASMQLNGVSGQMPVAMSISRRRCSLALKGNCDAMPFRRAILHRALAEHSLIL
jgi:hypothetical protein